MGLLQEFKYLRGALRTLRKTTPIAKNPKRVFPWVIEELAKRYGDKEALISDRERFTYRELDERANQYARWARAQGVGKGDVVCLLMLNRPEYMIAWLGILRAGGLVALLNTNLTGTPLAHSISIVSPKHVIVDSRLMRSFESAKAQLTVQPKIWAHGEGGGEYERLEPAIAAMDKASIPQADRPDLDINDRALFIYTSGTTGLPKAANINHYRLMLITHGFAGAMATTASDRMYDTLPMYHSNGGLIATGATLLSGGTVIIREKFSAREFWDDCVKWKCTLFIYIGELCRYLVTAPPSEGEKKHTIRLCCGNGIRPDVWGPFKERFRIPVILEFYGATEGNVASFNFDGTPGAIGRLPKYLAHRFPTRIVKFDVEKEEPVRDAQGRCIVCDVGEAGEAIGQIINDASKPANRFEGYADTEATKKKVLRDVFEQGDAWFRTGDLLRQDAKGYFYFVDRIGDTFRWKGENVSTNEVAEAFTVFPGIDEATVYGVPVKGYDGKAGMIALVAQHGVDFSALRSHVSKSLPEYARPIFVRLRRELDVTGTFKQRKVDLVKEGFDPAAIKDELYFYDGAQGAYVPLDKSLYERIQSRAFRL
ncbi:MAG TPA: long-chain-acyl-CoA synthetase [Xanthobacteraceae bacterium]|nr:long-chain-acyl-CoA synthetase [Xanthobacteraceae bacterium]